MSEQRSTSAAGHVSLEVGQPFNPFGMFHGIWVPECVARCRWLSAGAKLTLARLVRYGGRNGKCFPTMETLGQEVGVGERQAQKYVAELERHHLVRRISRYFRGAQTSNGFEFLWHELFKEGVNDDSPGRVNDRSGEGANACSPKESQFEESHSEETTTDKRISGYASPKTRSAASSSVMWSHEAENNPPKADAEQRAFTDPDPRNHETPRSGWSGEELAAVRHRIVTFWGREPEEGFEVSVMLRARGASAAAVCQLLDRKFADKNLRSGGRNAPRRQNWFFTVIENEFSPGHLPEPPSALSGDEHQLESAILDRGIEAIELPHAPRSIVESVTCSQCGEALICYTDGAVQGCGCQRSAGRGLKRVAASDVSVLPAGARRRVRSE
jgi:hypothetical protein